MITKVKIDGIDYAVYQVEPGEIAEQTVTYEGVTYRIGERLTSPELSGTVEKININGKIFDIRDVEDVEVEKKRAMQAEGSIRQTAMRAGFQMIPTAQSVGIDYSNIDGQRAVKSIPAATEELAGVMTAEDKRKMERTIEWSAESNANHYTDAGIYSITGIRKSASDNLPIGNVGNDASFAARLIVSVSPQGESVYRHIVGQTLILANAEGKETKIYTRSGNRTSYDGGATYTIEWGAWATQQTNVNVGRVDNLNNLTDNGIYSGVWNMNGNPLTFVCVTINDYALGINPRRVSQFVYGLSKADGSVSYKTRTGEGDTTITWGAWKDINEDSIQEIRDWINTEMQNLGEHISQVQESVNDTNTDLTETKKNIASSLHASSIADSVNITGKSDVGKTTFSVNIPAATQTTAGVMTAEDKKAVDGIAAAVEEGRKAALRALYIAAGAKYNNITGLYSLNGVDDLTEEQMQICYANKDLCTNLNWGNIARYMTQLRTIYPFPQRTTNLNVSQTTNGWSWNSSYTFMDCVDLEVFRICQNAPLDTTNTSDMLSATRLHWTFYDCVDLHTVYPINVENVTSFPNTFYKCRSLVNLRLYGVKYSLSLAQSPLISKESLLYIVNNSLASDTITITLHADAYATLAEDTDIISALEAKPLVTLVSA